MNRHEGYMQRCLDLAQKGLGSVSPNPMVGAVLVYNDIIIGEGYHEEYGSGHAEVNCIRSVRDEHKSYIKHSTLYISLEPCNHFGKTPPCTELIIQNEIKKVVVACVDPFEKVNGSGITMLRNAGVEVITGVLEKKAIALNKRFFVYHNNKRPYVILKWAQSSNGYIADDNMTSIKISNKFTDRLVHKWRSEEDAIMVGTNTVMIDNPLLTTRLWPGKNPIRIAVDQKLKLNPDSKIFDSSATTFIFNSSVQKVERETHFIKYNQDHGIINQLNAILYQRGIASLIVEGGATLINSFLKEGVWDEARVIVNQTMSINYGLKAPQLPNYVVSKKENIFNDEIRYVRPHLYQ